MDDLVIRQSIISQYRAALIMLGQAIDLCPEDLWTTPRFRNQSWHIAYHCVFYTHFYVQTSEADFIPWSKHTADAHRLSTKAAKPYMKADLREYLEHCRLQVELYVPSLVLEANSGFPWLPFNKLELQFYNIRHVQHHTGQLADRLRTIADLGLDWTRSG